MHVLWRKPEVCCDRVNDRMEAARDQEHRLALLLQELDQLRDACTAPAPLTRRCGRAAPCLAGCGVPGVYCGGCEATKASTAFPAGAHDGQPGSQGVLKPGGAAHGAARRQVSGRQRQAGSSAGGRTLPGHLRHRLAHAQVERQLVYGLVCAPACTGSAAEQGPGRRGEQPSWPHRVLSTSKQTACAAATGGPLRGVSTASARLRAHLRRPPGAQDSLAGLGHHCGRNT